MAAFLLTAALFGACTEADVAAPTASPETPSPSPRAQAGLCQPFPDRLIDDLAAAYNSRDLDALRSLVTAPRVEDVVAAAYDGDSSFDDVAEWAEAGWDAGDRMNNVAYNAFHPTRRGFQMVVMRRSDTLEEHGIAAVSMTLDAISRGCTIESLEASGDVQARGQPCAFYVEFADVPDVAADEPRPCRDGSGVHARMGSAIGWTGDEVLVWGGDLGGQFDYPDVAMDGVSFDPVEKTWRRVPAPDMPPFRPEAVVWTGAELIVAGDRTGRKDRTVGAAYDPGTRSWRSLGFPYQRWDGFEGVWTGRELVLWGGPSHSSRPLRRGAVYDPATRTWRRTAPAPVAGRWSHSVAWTGTEMIVWGGGDADADLGDGGAYDPSSDSWRKIAPAPVSDRQWMPLVWTGAELIVWGGSSVSRDQEDGAAYDPATDSWRKLAPSPLRGRHHHSATWTGTEIFFFGGTNYHRMFRDGAAYDPATDSWRRLPDAPVAPRCCHGAVWTGSELFVFGGSGSPGHTALGDGALYDPVTGRWRRVVPGGREGA
ncbi:MAG: hypothetical protein M3271_07415 [Actinomycetota bacterium]|nr:hypothetical protein [Actinomycetota bacterium]